MKRLLINYVVKPERAEENQVLIRNVFAELKKANLAGVKYQVYKMGNNVFVHIVQFADEEANRRFTELAAFRTFRKEMDLRLEEKPVTNQLFEIGSYSSLETEE